MKTDNAEPTKEEVMLGPVRLADKGHPHIASLYTDCQAEESEGSRKLEPVRLMSLSTVPMCIIEDCYKNDSQLHCRSYSSVSMREGARTGYRVNGEVIIALRMQSESAPPPQQFQRHNYR